jgi:NitT/TauT family transport system substrate-binding protein
MLIARNDFRQPLGWIVISLVVSLLSFSLSACTLPPPPTMNQPAPPAPTEKRALNVCTSSVSPTMMNLQYALAEDIFAQYGLDVQVTEITGGPIATAALIAGDVDLCQIAGSAIVGAAVAGAELVIVGGVTNQQPYYLVTRPEIVAPSDLVGKALAVSSPGSSSYTAAIAVLKHFGLILDQDVAILAIGGQNERMAALESGNIVGTILSPPQAMLAAGDGFRILFDFADLEDPYQHNAIVTTRSFLQQHPELVTAYIQATSAAVSAMLADKPHTIGVMAEYLQLDPSEQAEALELTYDLVIQRYMKIRPAPSLPGIQALLDELVTDNPQAANFAPGDFVDLGILTQLDAEGFFEKLGAADE